jgi:putative redox protein
MAEVEVFHVEGDRFLIEVRDHALMVDQPEADGGDDLGPTPTELFVGSLASCVGFYAGRFLRRHDLPVAGLRVHARFDMAERPARVGSVSLQVVLPPGVPLASRAALLAVVEHCTVHNSIKRTPDVRIELTESVTVAA